jgi:putative PIN family toxin of toxin-antitoxin system
MIVTVDTNVFIEALFFKEEWCLKVLEKEFRKEIVFAMNQATYTELMVVFMLHIAKSEISDERRYRLCTKLSNIIWRVIKTDNRTKSIFCTEDKDDNKFIDCAIDSKSEYLITLNQKHIKPEFESLIKRDYKHNLQIVNPYNFVAGGLQRKFNSFK